MSKTENLVIYEKFGKTPSIAQKKIEAGRLKGMTDINPMYRIKALTETFGPVGIGWYYDITNKWTEKGADGVISAFVDINLYIKYNGEWSMPIQGTGGSAFVSKEKDRLYTDDDAYKKALTDAISIACKALGMCADIYYSKDNQIYGTKYERSIESANSQVVNEVEYDVNSKIEAGKKAGKTWLEVYRETPDYYDWCIKNAKSESSKKKYEKILQLCKKEADYIKISDEDFKFIKEF